MASYLTVIGDRVALAWVLRSSMMAFPTTRRSEVDRLQPGDELFLLSTRGCFRNPTRDRTRVIGRAVLSTPVALAPDPIELVGRTFNRTGSLQITGLAPVLSGIELAPLVPRLEAFPNKQAWSIWLRRPLLRLTQPDADLLRPMVLEIAIEPRRALQGYLDIGKDSLVDR
jgi:hypothetical protein